MKNLLLLSFCLLTISCVSVKFPETLSVNVELDKESAKNLTEAINNSNYKTIMMTHHKEKGMTMANEENIILEFADELPNNVKEGVNQIKRIMVRGEKFGKGPNTSKYMETMNTFNERIFAFPVKYEIKFQKKKLLFLLMLNISIYNKVSLMLLPKKN